MNWEEYLAQWISEAPILAGSAAVVLFMVGVAAVLGFRQTAKLDEAELVKLAAAEGASVAESVIDDRGSSALVQLHGDKFMIVRVMGNDISARILPASAVELSLRDGKLTARFADLGFPPLHLRLQAPPPWIAALAGETT